MTGCDLPVFMRVFSSLAAKYAFFMEQKASVDPVAFLHEALTFDQAAIDLPRATAWFTFQEWLCRVAALQHMALQQLDQATRAICQTDVWQQAELTLLGELVMHYRDNCPTWHIPWATVEALSATQLDDSVRCRHLIDSTVPATVWVEWPEAPSPSRHKPWLTSVRGLLISRFAAFEVPAEQRENLATDAKKHTGSQRRELMQVFQDLNALSDPMAYCVIAVTLRHGRLDFCPIFFGHERKASVHDLLALHKIASDNDHRKKKELEQVWANISMRLLLYAISANLFEPSLQVAINKVPPERIGPAAQFAYERGTIVMRKLAQRTFQPFRLEV